MCNKLAQITARSKKRLADDTSRTGKIVNLSQLIASGGRYQEIVTPLSTG